MNSFFSPLVKRENPYGKILPFPQISSMFPKKFMSHLDLINKFGLSSTAFLTSYDHYLYFHLRSDQESNSQASIAYVETPTAWVVSGDPVGPKHLWLTLLQQFIQTAFDHNKSPLLLPASKELVDLVRQEGVPSYILQIGQEPWIQLNERRHSSDFFKILPSAKKLQKQGGRVQEFNPLQATPQEFQTVEKLKEDWFQNRKCATLDFLNKVDLFKNHAQKKYFQLVYKGQCQAFLAAVPIPARQSWYLVDLMRSPNSVAGSSELLIIEAMAALKKIGAREVTLGLSPLTPELTSETPNHPNTYKMLHWIYNNFNNFYGFKSLAKFKEKFEPESWEAQYLIVFTPKLSGNLSLSVAGKSLLGLFYALFPKGILHTIIQTLKNSIAQFYPTESFQPFLSSQTILNPLPQQKHNWVLSLPVTWSFVFLILLSWTLNSATVSLGHWTTLLFSTFLLSSLIETFAGPHFMILPFIIGFFSNQLISHSLIQILPHLDFIHKTPLTFFNHLSLGVFAIFGSILVFLNTKTRIGIGLLLTSLVFLSSRSELSFNILIAILLGNFSTQYLLHFRNRRKVQRIQNHLSSF